MRRSSKIQKTLVRFVMKCLNKAYLTKFFAVTRHIVVSWCRRCFYSCWEGFNDETRNPKNEKINVGVFILALNGKPRGFNRVSIVCLKSIRK